jgi:hypothetical protein
MFPLILTLALATPAASPVAAPPLAPPDGTYTYVLAMNGTAIGKNAITVKRDPSGSLVLTESGSGNMNGQNGTIADTLTLAPDLAPSQYSSLASIADSKSMKSVVSFKGGEATQSGDVNKRYDLVADAKHFVLMDFGPFTGFFALPAQMEAWNRPPVLAIVPMYGQGFPLTVDAALKPVRPATVPASDEAMSFNSMVQITLWYDPKTLVVDEVDVPTQGVTVKRVS